jgi:co-chaperonin GroES (HSP10)
MKLIPQNDYILVKIVERETKTTTDSGIILGEVEKLPPKIIIDSFGPDVSTEDLSAGDEVILRPGAGFPIYGEDVQYKSITKEDILVKIETL